MRLIWKRAFFLWLLFYASTTNAVDSDLFSQDDFVDPRTQGFVFNNDTNNNASKGDDLILSNIQIGAATNYQQRNVFTESEAYYGSFNLNYYYNALQFGVSYDKFDTLSDDSVARDRIKLLFGFYQLEKNIKKGSRSSNDVLSRTLITIEKSNTDTGEVNQVGLEVDLDFFGILGGLSFTKRIIAEEEDEHRILFRYTRSHDWLPLDYRLSFGIAEIENSWDFATSKLAANYHFQIPNTFSEIHLYYSFSYRPERDHYESRSNSEFGVFVNIPISVLSY